MYNFETERTDGEEREEGGQGENKSKQEREKRGEGARGFHVSPEFKRPPFHVSIVIFSLFSFHLLHLSPRDRDITLPKQAGQRPESVSLLQHVWI